MQIFLYKIYIYIYIYRLVVQTNNIMYIRFDWIENFKNYLKFDLKKIRFEI